MEGSHFWLGGLFPWISVLTMGIGALHPLSRFPWCRSCCTPALTAFKPPHPTMFVCHHHAVCTVPASPGESSESSTWGRAVARCEPRAEQREQRQTHTWTHSLWAPIAWSRAGGCWPTCAPQSPRAIPSIAGLLLKPVEGYPPPTPSDALWYKAAPCETFSPAGTIL